ncbi:zinc-ribbon domain-containing protein [Aliiroseovarius sp. KMU-50]|uniref:Zinc-ribbon domain-containing protein n=1 Tax=Aliiroseovarius salicola TaxID=3009082 RepID=A0ABT4VWR5_9RHOB|nr:zinc-ribbon domain-containing protein [Aliiroseovarius sp. KMU-50]MDA5092683.1 zinc-ribbon domain-containing protein [Aliiroseovarius sp. KMU-50]
MRLVCPNCGAQYEVDDRVMPAGGRDVQCSACGHAWFQKGAQSATEEEPPEQSSEQELHSSPPEPQSDVEDEQEQATSFDTLPTDDTEADENPLGANQRELDPDVKSILQEEAQRELDARHSEQEQIETQTEMGLDEFEQDDGQRQSIRERMARLRGTEDEFEAIEALPEGRGKDLLPDIEEINSTLDANSDPEPETDMAAEVPAVKKGSFRSGFLWVVLFALLALAVYTYAPTLAEKLPQIKAPLASYVEFVDQIRTQLNSAIESAIGKMRGMDEGNN